MAVTCITERAIALVHTKMHGDESHECQAQPPPSAVAVIVARGVTEHSALVQGYRERLRGHTATQEGPGSGGKLWPMCSWEAGTDFPWFGCAPGLLLQGLLSGLCSARGPWVTGSPPLGCVSHFLLGISQLSAEPTDGCLGTPGERCEALWAPRLELSRA